MRTWLICGGRDYKDAKLIFNTLDRLAGIEDFALEEAGLALKLRIVHGNARGADTIADVWARVRGHDFQPYPADWTKFKNKAGKIRNAEMLEEEDVDTVIAFPGGWGTLDMVTKARAAGIPVIEVTKTGEFLRK